MNRLLAALMFFTRLPLWKWFTVPSDCFKRVVELWPMVGWITGGFTALVLYAASLLFPPFMAVVIAVIARVLLTGALHEDGLADFFDGFGGGVSRERILAIMKDSHIGTYGVLALVLYFLLITACWSSIDVPVICFVIMAGDPWAKLCASQIVSFLPYARKREEAKNKTVYEPFSLARFLTAFVFGALPVLLIPMRLWWACLAPILTIALLILLMRMKIGGYTGDCCGASFLLCELSFYITVVALWN